MRTRISFPESISLGGRFRPAAGFSPQGDGRRKSADTAFTITGSRVASAAAVDREAQTWAGSSRPRARTGRVPPEIARCGRNRHGAARCGCGTEYALVRHHVCLRRVIVRRVRPHPPTKACRRLRLSGRSIYVTLL